MGEPDGLKDEWMDNIDVGTRQERETFHLERHATVLRMYESSQAVVTVLEGRIERLRAAVAFCYPDDMTPNAKRMFELILDGGEA